MASYVQLHGKHFGPSGEKDENGKPIRKKFVKGDIVELSPEQYDSFRDKFKPMAVVKAEAEVAIAQADAIAKLEREKAEALKSKDGNVGAPVAPVLAPNPPQTGNQPGNQPSNSTPAGASK